MPCAPWGMTTSERIEGQPAFVLHSRPYRESSCLVDYLTPGHGLVRAVVRGVRKPRSRTRQAVQPFVALQIGWAGRGELKTLLGGETDGPALLRSGRRLLCGFYLNELLCRLLRNSDASARLFALYRFSLEELANSQVEEEIVLRLFERQLLAEIGSGLELTQDTQGAPLQQERLYRFDPQQGFLRSRETTDTLRATLFRGASLLAIGQDHYSDAGIRRDAKRLMRQALAELLGGESLKSRQLFSRPGPFVAPANNEN